MRRNGYFLYLSNVSHHRSIQRPKFPETEGYFRYEVTLSSSFYHFSLCMHINGGISDFPLLVRNLILPSFLELTDRQTPIHT